MTEEQRQAALEAICRLEPDAKNYREEYPTQCESADGDAMIVRAAIQSPPVPVIEGLDEAIIVLSEHNKWRRGEHPYDGDHPQPMEITPKQLGLAIECVLKASSAYAKLQKG